MSIFCRPICLYNDFVPARTGEFRKCTYDYKVLGYHDGLSPKEPFLLENGNSFEKMFKEYVNNGVAKEYFSQVLFGLYSDTRKEIEQDIWKCDYPFMYVVLLQFEEKNIVEYNHYLQSHDYLINEFEILKVSSEYQNIKIMTYYSLDNTEIIMLMKCCNSKIGIEIINNLHQNKKNRHPFNIKNTYSMLAIQNEAIKDADNFKAKNEKIPLLELRIVEHNSKLTGMFYTKLKEDISREEGLQEKELEKNEIFIERKLVLGTEDEVITVQNIKWKTLISLYKDETGILCNCNKISQIYINAVSAKIMIPVLNNNLEVEKENNSNGKLFFLCDNLRDDIKEIYLKKEDGEQYSEYKTLMMITNSLWRFERSHYQKGGFADYNFFTMILPFQLFVEFLQQRDNITEHYSSTHFFEFVQTIKLRTQNFSKPDRIYFQITDFNIRYFEVPAKFIVFYSAYIYYLKKYLNTEQKRQYEFLLCPGVNNQMGVKELFPRTFQTKRLLLVEMPENQLYQLKCMMIMLGHEIAHFVGSGIRLREERTKSMIRMTSYILVQGIIAYMQKRKIFGDIEYNIFVKKEFIQNLEDKIIFYIGLYKEEKFWENSFRDKSKSKNNVKFHKIYGNHSELLVKNLLNVAEDVLKKFGTQLFNWMIWEIPEKEWEKQKYKSKTECYQEKMKEIQTCIEEIFGKRERNDTFFILNKGLEQITYLLKECYADMISILTLRLSLKDYLKSFVEFLDRREIEILEDTQIIPRLAIVCSVISYPYKEDEKEGKENRLYYWTNKELEGYEEWETDIQTLLKYVLIFFNKYLKKNQNDEEEIKISLAINDEVTCIYNDVIAEEVMIYLLKCRRAYYDKTDDKAKEKLLKRIQNFYSIANITCADELFKTMMELLCAYEKELYHDIEKINKIKIIRKLRKLEESRKVKKLKKPKKMKKIKKIKKMRN